MSKEMIIVSVGSFLILSMSWGIYNKLVRARNEVINMFAQIDVQLKRRYDLIPNLVEVARKYLEHEAETLQAVIQARARAVSSSEAASLNPASKKALTELAGAEAGLGGALGRLMMVAEAYPELKADTTMASLSEEILSSENRVGFARQAYNDSVLDYNNLANMFPNIFVAIVFRFRTLPMLKSIESEAERLTPKVKF